MSTVCQMEGSPLECPGRLCQQSKSPTSARHLSSRAKAEACLKEDIGVSGSVIKMLRKLRWFRAGQDTGVPGGKANIDKCRGRYASGQGQPKIS